MSEPAAIVTSHALRVHVDARDLDRHAALAAIVAASGHTLVDLSSAQIVLADGESSAPVDVPVVMLGIADDDNASVLPPNASPAQIDAALRAAAVGLLVRAREEERAFDALPERPAQNLLSPRETEVLAHVADGLSNKEIARRLEISLHTVKFHIESLLRKLGARSRAEAVAKAVARRHDHTIEL
jgi:DNA-binding CsgD family transcriptional regulator